MIRELGREGGEEGVETGGPALARPLEVPSAIFGPKLDQNFNENEI